MMEIDEIILTELGSKGRKEEVLECSLQELQPVIIMWRRKNPPGDGGGEARKIGKAKRGEGASGGVYFRRKELWTSLRDAERSRKKRLHTLAILFKMEVIGDLIKNCFTEVVG